MRIVTVLTVTVAILFALSATADAVEVEIINPGFEASALGDDEYDYTSDNQGWGFFNNGGYIGAWNVTAATYPGRAPEGNNIGWTEPGDGEPGGFAQILTETLTEGGTYTLTVEVGNGLGYAWNGYRVQLLAGGVAPIQGDGSGDAGEVIGGTLLAQDDNSIVVADGTFVTSTVMYTYDPDLHSDLLGEPLQIRLLALGADEVEFDDVKLDADKMNPYPANGDPVLPGNVELSWTNMDPNTPEDPVFVDVWFGTDPNGGVFNKIVTAGQNTTSVTVDASELGTYFWQVNSYINGSATGDPIMGNIYSFYSTNDTPPSIDAGDSMVTWSDEPVQLDATVDDDGTSALTYAWTADPADGVVFSATDVEDPIVTITKAPGDPLTVTLTVAVNDVLNPPVEDTLTIDVYDDACLAARIAEGLAADNPADLDGNCIVDLRDYAIIAATWLEDTALTEPVAK